jgi:hypothetical protein
MRKLNYELLHRRAKTGDNPRNFIVSRLETIITEIKYRIAWLLDIGNTNSTESRPTVPPTE